MLARIKKWCKIQTLLLLHMKAVTNPAVSGHKLQRIAAHRHQLRADAAAAPTAPAAAAAQHDDDDGDYDGCCTVCCMLLLPQLPRIPLLCNCSSCYGYGYRYYHYLEHRHHDDHRHHTATTISQCLIILQYLLLHAVASRLVELT